MEKVAHSEKFKDFAQTLASGSSVILLRHAESKHNEASRNLKSRECTLEERANERASAKHRDGPITKLGKKQCKEASNVTNEFNVEVVLISPMRRTLQTAYHVFKKHPNFNSIKFIVVPTLKELLGSLCSVPENIASVMEEFKPMFPNFDRSLFNKYEDPLHFYLEDISDDFAKRILLEKESSH